MVGVGKSAHPEGIKRSVEKRKWKYAILYVMYLVLILNRRHTYIQLWKEYLESHLTVDLAKASLFLFLNKRFLYWWIYPAQLYAFKCPNKSDILKYLFGHLKAYNCAGYVWKQNMEKKLNSLDNWEEWRMAELGVKKAQRGKWREEQFPWFCTLLEREILQKKDYFSISLTLMRGRANGWELTRGWSNTCLPSSSLDTMNKRKLSRPHTPAF